MSLQEHEPAGPDGPLRVAVLGDLHGHFGLAYRILSRWQCETGHRLDLILQVGDLGAFPRPYRLDAATMGFAEKDPDELSFADWQEGCVDADQFLDPDAAPERAVPAPLVFVKGNHEDFIYLARELPSGEVPVALDVHGQFCYLPGGQVMTFERGAHRLVVAGLGGVGSGARDDTEHYTPAEVRAVAAAASPIDILLTHEPPFGRAVDGAGSRDVERLLGERRPRFHFCGHYHMDGQRLPAAAGVESWLLNAVGFRRAHQVNPGCIGVLTWAGRDAAAFELLAAPWLREFTRAGFRWL